ncbi:MAG: endopeptidase La [Ignavibacteria bacterium]|nr:endopeptidase La [Ignavibacteria bacterium]
MPTPEDVLTSLLEDKKKPSIPKKITVLPLRDVVLFPNMIFPVLIGRSSSLKAVSEAMERDKFIFVAAQKDPSVEEPTHADIYKHGTVAKILQVLRLPNNLLKVLVEGVFQGKITSVVKNTDFLEAKVDIIHPKYDEKDVELQAMVRRTSERFADYVKTNRNLAPEIVAAYDNLDDFSRKLYYAAANVDQKVDLKQRILEKTTMKEQFYELISIMSAEIEVLKLEEELDEKINDTMQKTQKKYFIQEQIRTLQKELDDDDESNPEISTLREAIDKAQMPEEALAKANEELEKLKKTPSMSPEFSVIRSYIETLASLPWTTKTTDNLRIDHVRSILDADHYDLEKPKERILEYISVLNIVGSLRGQILCFVGPPGVGKTSLGKSIARALDRKFVRIALGGVRDEAEIRGHRKTYIGSMPGKIIASMKKAGTINPVILLDEVDKMAMDFRGDPSSAFLEVLDPEQNSTFNDHYLEVDYDLSKVLFITTANVKYDIPAPLLDRMEVIEISSYLDHDKLEIVKRHLIPKLLSEFGLQDVSITFTDEAIMKVIREYTREAGVRNVEREISSLLRKVAKELVLEFEAKQSAKAAKKNVKEGELGQIAKFKIPKNKKYIIDEALVEKFLKVPRFRAQANELSDKIGVATGLAWTSMGGDTLPVEVTIMPGTEKLTLTGKLGDVMKESATAALSYVRSNWYALGVPEEFAKNKEIHIHAPEGAIPKDGPSAGITMSLALISAATLQPLRGDLAMTGEITLRGNILPIGGLNEKLLAAKRKGYTTVLIPKDNQQDIAEINPIITSGLNIVPVGHLTEALPYAFRTLAVPVTEPPKKSGKKKEN